MSSNSKRPRVRGPSDPVDDASPEVLVKMRSVALKSALKYGAADTAEDVAQETVERLLVRWDDKGVADARRRGLTSFLRFVAVTAHNVLLSNIRKDVRRRDREAWYGSDDHVPISDRPGARVPRPRDSSGIDRLLGRRLLGAAIEQLGTERQRECATLIWLEGHNVKETAEVLDLSPAAVRKHMRLANSFLRSWMK